MLGLGSSFYTGPWNTNFVGDFLLIPDDQLKVIDSIPEWKTQKETNDFCSTDKDLAPVSNSKSSKETCQPNNSLPSVPASKIKKTLNSKFTKDKGNLPSLSKLTHSRSVPDLNLLPLNCSLQSSKSETNIKDLFLKMSSQPTFLRKSLVEKNPVNETYSVKDAENRNEKLSPHISAKRKAFENLGDHIIEHPFLKSTVNSVQKVITHSEADRITNKEDKLVSMRKKVMLLEKRFSPSKDVDGKIKNVSNFSLKKKDSSTSQQLHSISTVEASTTQNVDKVLDMDKSSPDDTTIENNQHGLEKNLDIHKDLVAECNEENFISQPISCGQLQKSNISSCNILPSMKNKELLPKVLCTTPTFSVFSKNQSEVHELERKKASTKRKRRNRNAKSSKKCLGSSSPPYIKIQYTPDQVKSLINIIKHFNL